MTPEDVVRRAAADFRPSDEIRIGAEVEWHILVAGDPTAVVAASTVAEIADGPLPGGGRITIEPGGQLELVTPPLAGPGELGDALAADTVVLVERFARRGLVLVSAGVDHRRPPERTLDHPRYEAMEAHFAAHSPAGLTMMSRTASLQLNVDFGPDPAITWAIADRFGPLLTAMFANSPTLDGVSFTLASRRQQVWAATDPTRTRSVGPDPATWPDYVLAAMVMTGSSDTQTLAQCLTDPNPPTPDELDRHLTTLFPPVRPRGWIELRMIDAVPPGGRAAAIQVVWTLLTDPDRRQAADAMMPSELSWDRAAAHGRDDPAIQQACLDVLDLMPGATCAAWRAHVASGRTPTVDELYTPEPGE